MPYIDPAARYEMWSDHRSPNTPGELNYAITGQVLNYLEQEPSYTDFNDVIGVLECVKMELYRRMVAPYEDCKCKENGDVYPSE